MTVHTRTHVLIGFDNPFFICEICRNPVKYWHDSNRCGCDDTGYHFHPCGHIADLISICPSWNPVEGCTCSDKEKHDKE